MEHVSSPLESRVRQGPAGLAAGHGFTLLEVMVVVALLALAAAVAAALLGGGMDGVRLRGAAQEIAVQLRHTRAHAMATGQVQSFVIDPAAHRYSAPGRGDGRIDDALAIRFQGARELVPVAGQGAIEFHPDGASSGGRIELAAGSAVRRIDVAWLTGRVRLADASDVPR